MSVVPARLKQPCRFPKGLVRVSYSRSSGKLKTRIELPPGSDGRTLLYTKREKGKIGWRFDGNTLTTIIQTSRFSVHTPVRIQVQRAKGSLETRIQVDGFEGSIERLRSANDGLNNLFPAVSLPDQLIDARQTGDRLTYHPETARAEIARLSKLYGEAMAAVDLLAAHLLEARLNSADSEPRKKALLEIMKVQARLKDGFPNAPVSVFRADK